MAGKKSDIEFEKVTLRLGKGDVQRMSELFPKLGGHVAIRTLLRNFIKRIDSANKPLDIDIIPSDIEEILHDERDTAGTNPAIA